MREGKNCSALAVATWTAWLVVGLLIVVMWVSVAFGWHAGAPAAGFTACAGSAVAATLHIRRFTCRTQDLIRSMCARDDLRERELFEMGRDSVTMLHPQR